jgi:transposase-like protein
MKRALKRHGAPEAITTHGLRSYRAAMKELGNAGKQEVAFAKASFYHMESSSHLTDRT